MISPSAFKQYLKNMPPGSADLFLKAIQAYCYGQMPVKERGPAQAVVDDVIRATSSLSVDTVMWIVCIVSERIVRSFGVE